MRTMSTNLRASYCKYIVNAFVKRNFDRKMRMGRSFLMKHYVSTEVKCPFYCHEAACEMHCLGFSAGMNIHICFGSKERKTAHKAKYCCDIRGYLSCPIYIESAKNCDFPVQ